VPEDGARVAGARDDGDDARPVFEQRGLCFDVSRGQDGIAERPTPIPAKYFDAGRRGPYPFGQDFDRFLVGRW